MRCIASRQSSRNSADSVVEANMTEKLKREFQNIVPSWQQNTEYQLHQHPAKPTMQESRALSFSVAFQA
ncbi:Hypothetical predicted protein [Octopus vulgaris]|uniref:Uncharacterized protein n=1 Tax=Octopus vulgaris TaxID=6645 RepID=A0AA36B9I6_OCTVU|nr:Hypothetical predicted protein [Octopus vulgaris]